MGKPTSGTSDNGFAQQDHGDPEGGLRSKIAKATKTEPPFVHGLSSCFFLFLIGLRGLLCSISSLRFP
jgi:hypothetical protein